MLLASGEDLTDPEHSLPSRTPEARRGASSARSGSPDFVRAIPCLRAESALLQGRALSIAFITGADFDALHFEGQSLLPHFENVKGLGVDDNLRDLRASTHTGNAIGGDVR